MNTQNHVKNLMMPLDLQLFAEDGTEGAGAQTPPTFDDLLKDKGNQAEFDRRVTKALETAKAKWQEDAQTKLAEAKTEAEKLARMTLEQKAQHEREKRDKEIADREAAFLCAQNALRLTKNVRRI